MSRRSISRLILLLAAALAPAAAFAQAWLPDKGTLNTSLLFNNVLYTQHWTPTGDTGARHTSRRYVRDARELRHHRSVMVSGALPYIAPVTRDRSPSHGGAAGIRSRRRRVHGTLTDLRLGVHYQLLEKPFALAPFIAYVTPVTDYYTRGHAAPGRGLDELMIGFSAGKSLDPWIPRTYAQLRYSYAFVEEVHDITHDRTNLNLELGTFFTPRWNVSLYGAWQWTHGGINVPVPPGSPLLPGSRRLAEDEFFNAGFGTGFALTPEMTAFATYMHGIDGKNGHKVDQV